MPAPRLLRLLPAAVLLMAAATSEAASLQVAPTQVRVSAGRAADGLTLANNGSSPLQAQVRAYLWTQQDGEDVLVPTRDIAVSPPMVGLAGGATQLVRVVRLGPPPQDGAEAAYRILVDELPPADDTGRKPGLISAPIDQTSSVTLACTRRTPWHLALDDGQNAAGGVRRMRLGSSSSHVAYELYRDPGRTQRWGGAIGADTAAGTGEGTPQTVTVYGRVPAPQAVPAGQYQDVVRVTITY